MKTGKTNLVTECRGVQGDGAHCDLIRVPLRMLKTGVRVSAGLETIYMTV